MPDYLCPVALPAVWHVWFNFTAREPPARDARGARWSRDKGPLEITSTKEKEFRLGGVTVGCWLPLRGGIGALPTPAPRGRPCSPAGSDVGGARAADKTQPLTSPGL